MAALLLAVCLVSVPPYEPALPDVEEPPLPVEPYEPALPGIEEPLPVEPYEPALPGIEEPASLEAPHSASADERGTRMALVGTPPATRVVTSPIGRERFLDITVDDGLRLRVWGPGLLTFAIHAHRSEASPDSMRPVIVSLLIDEVLTRNVSVDQGVSPEYRFEDAAFLPSLRVNVRVPVEGGRHEVRVALSDSAVFGASILPTFESLTDVDEPGLLTSRAARGADLRAEPTRPDVSGAISLGLSGAAWLPAGMRHIGLLAQLEGLFGIPVAGPRLSAGLAGGYGRAEDPRRFADGRVPGGTGRANVVVSHVPLLADVRWSAPIARPFGVEAGVGGGVQLVWTEVRSRGVRSRDGPEVAPIGYIHVTLLFHLGPGEVMVRGAFLAAVPVDTNRLRSFDTGGALAALGYRLALISGD